MWKSFFANQLAAAIWKIIHRFRVVSDENYLKEIKSKKMDKLKVH
jgi:hypothetical protein